MFYFWRNIQNNKKHEISYSSFCLYEYLVKEVIIPNIPDKPINSISEIDCRNFKEYLYNSHYSTARKNSILNHLRNIFFHAHTYFELNRDPSAQIRPFKVKYEERMKSYSREQNIWTYDDFNKFIVNVTDVEYEALFITLFLTGMRLGESLALNWNDLHEKYISITKAQCKKCAQGGYIIKEPKNPQSIRKVSINSTLYRYLMTLKSIKSVDDQFSDSWFIFGGIDPLPRTTIERVKNKAAKKAGIKKIRLHDLRHSHASNLIGSGMDIVAVSRRLGHSDVSTTLKVYTHMIKKNDDLIVEYIEESSHDLLTDK